MLRVFKEMDDHHDVHSIGQSDHESEININVFNEQINELDIDESVRKKGEEFVFSYFVMCYK